MIHFNEGKQLCHFNIFRLSGSQFLERKLRLLCEQILSITKRPFLEGGCRPLKKIGESRGNNKAVNQYTLIY